MYRYFILLFLLASCVSTQQHHSYKKYSHKNQKTSYWEVSKSEYNKINQENPRLKYHLKSEAKAALKAHQNEWDGLDLAWPTSGTLTSPFGMRTLRHRTRMHKGIDIAAKTGTPVYAAENGRVKFNGVKRGYGKAIILKHDSTYNTLYAHLSRSVVKPNQIVRKNQLIGYIGRTGYTTGSNLHFEMLVNDLAQDPLEFLPGTNKTNQKVRVGEAIIVKNRHHLVDKNLKKEHSPKG